MESDFVMGTQKFDFTVDEGTGVLNPSRDKKERQAPQKEGGILKRMKNKNSCVLAFLVCDPGWCAQKMRTGAQNRWDDNTHTDTCLESG